MLPNWVTFPIIPYKRMSINTALSVQDAVSVLSNAVRPLGPLSLGELRMSLLEGEITKNGFRVHLPIHRPLGCHVVLRGKLIPTSSGTRLDIDETLDSLCVGVSALLCSLSGIALLISVYVWVTTGDLNGIRWSIGLLFFCYLLDVVTFALDIDDVEHSMNAIMERYRIAVEIFGRHTKGDIGPLLIPIARLAFGVAL